jgi:hypothetical protein
MNVPCRSKTPIIHAPSLESLCHCRSNPASSSFPMTTVGWGALARAVAAETVTATSEPTATVPERSNVRRFRAAMRTGIRCSAGVSEGSAGTSAQVPAADEARHRDALCAPALLTGIGPRSLARASKRSADSVSGGVPPDAPQTAEQPTSQRPRRTLLDPAASSPSRSYERGAHGCVAK